MMQGLLDHVKSKDFSPAALFFLCLSLVLQVCPGAAGPCTLDGTSLTVGSGQGCSIAPGSYSFTEDVTVQTGGILDIESDTGGGVTIQCDHFVVEPGGQVLANGVSDVTDADQTQNGAGGKHEYPV